MAFLVSSFLNLRLDFVFARARVSSTLGTPVIISHILG